MNRKSKVSPQHLPPFPHAKNPKNSLPQAQNSALGMNKHSLQEHANSHAPPHLIDIVQSVPAPLTLYTCRICLQQHPPLHANNEQQLKSMLSQLQEQQSFKEPKHVITACRCQGTAAYVHQKCMIQWIDAQYNRSKEKQMKCQICLEQILYDRKTIPYFQFKCKNLEDVSGCNIACITSVMLILALFIGLQTQSAKLQFNQLTILTLYVLIGVLSITMGISVIMIIKQAFYKTKKQTVKIYSNDEIEICGILKDSLTHYDRRSTYRTQTNARSIRSIRSVREVDRSRTNERTQSSRNSRNGANHQNSHRQRSQRPSRTNIQSRQSHQSQRIRSQRNIRSARNNTSTRTIQVRSRQEIEQQVQN